MLNFALFLAVLSLASLSAAQPKFTVVEPPLQDGIESLAFTSANHGVVVYGYDRGDSGNVHLTRDGGKTWARVTATDRPITHDVKFADSLLGFIYERISLMQVTTDGGNTWFKLPVKVSDVSAPSPSLVFALQWAATDHAGFNLYRSTDRGLTWDELSQFHPKNKATHEALGSRVSFRDSLHGIVLAAEEDRNSRLRHARIFYTSDGGATWSEPLGDWLSTGYFNYVTYVGNGQWILHGSLLFDENTQRQLGSIYPDYVGVQAGTDRVWCHRIGKIDDGVDTLVEFGDGGTTIRELVTGTNFYEFNALNDKVGAVVTRTTAGWTDTTRILVTTTGWRGKASVEEGERSDLHQLIKSITPNPAIGEIRLELNATDAQIAVIDLLGAEVLRTKSERIDVSGLPSGTYYVRVSTSSDVQTKRVVISR